MSMARPILGIFIREPAPGKVKRRLAKTVGDEAACRIYAASVRSTLRTARDTRLPIRIFCAPEGDVAAVRRMFRLRLPIDSQRGATLGARMRHAFRNMLSSSDSALLIGSDSPTLPCAFLQRAAAELRRTDVVLGPAVDGGYYLIGLTRKAFTAAAPALFSRISWGGASVFDVTARRARSAQLRVSLLPEWRDIDTARDLAHPDIAAWLRRCNPSGLGTQIAQ